MQKQFFVLHLYHLIINYMIFSYWGISGRIFTGKMIKFDDKNVLRQKKYKKLSSENPCENLKSGSQNPKP